MGLRRTLEERSVTLTSSLSSWDSEFPNLFRSAKTASGKKVSQDGALQLIAVYSCISLIADGVSMLPTDIYQEVGEKRKLSKNTPAYIKTPNPFQTPQAFWHRVVVSMAMDGNAFIYTMRNEKGAVVALYALHPQEVTIRDLPGGEVKYQYGGEEYDRSQILHIPMFTRPGVSRGLSPLDAAAEAVGLGLTAEEFGARFFGQGTTMTGVIEHPGLPKNDEAKMLREMFRKTHSGTKNSHAVGVLTGGATFKPISITPEHAQFLETRRFQNHQIALLYHVPIYMVDPTVTSSWGSGIEEQNKGFIDYALMPYIVRIEQAISIYLLGANRYLKFNLDSRLRPKTKERYDAYAVAINNGWMSIDEVRALEDAEPLPDGKGSHYYRPLNEYAIDEPLPDSTPDTPAEEQIAAQNGAQGASEANQEDKPLKQDQARSVQMTVTAPPVELRVEPVINLLMPEQAPRTKTVIRDEDGEITHVIEE